MLRVPPMLSERGLSVGFSRRPPRYTATIQASSGIVRLAPWMVRLSTRCMSLVPSRPAVGPVATKSSVMPAHLATSRVGEAWMAVSALGAVPVASVTFTLRYAFSVRQPEFAA